MASLNAVRACTATLSRIQSFTRAQGQTEATAAVSDDVLNHIFIAKVAWRLRGTRETCQSGLASEDPVPRWASVVKLEAMGVQTRPFKFVNNNRLLVTCRSCLLFLSWIGGGQENFWGGSRAQQHITCLRQVIVACLTMHFLFPHSETSCSFLDPYLPERGA